MTLRRTILLVLYTVSMTNLLFLEAFLFASDASWTSQIMVAVEFSALLMSMPIVFEGMLRRWRVFYGPEWTATDTGMF